MRSTKRIQIGLLWLVGLVLTAWSASAMPRANHPIARPSHSVEGGRHPAQPFYAANPNHREIALNAFDLAVKGGFLDTAGISHLEIKDRLDAGAYSEDYDMIPGKPGEHFPDPWDQGPEYDFDGLYPFSRIPYGSLDDSLSGWFRSFPHGYDPVQAFTWPGTSWTTVGWANAPANTFTWDHAVSLYRAGKKAEAYECVGHLLHLLADLSMPEHVKVVNHGVALASMKSGTLFDPDIATLVVDEYELSLAGGVELPDVITLIPDLLGVFHNALSTAQSARIPHLPEWREYFVRLATHTYDDSLVNRYFAPPAANGEWGSYKNESGERVVPEQYGITPPAPIGERWTQFSFKSTATINGGTIIPPTALIEMCDSLVPAAVEYCAGLLLKFLEEANSPGTGVREVSAKAEEFRLENNYPNPFNPATSIRYSVLHPLHIRLAVYDMLGREVAILVDDVRQPGIYTATWNAIDQASGFYLYQMRAGEFVETRKALLLR
jgi:hypothetical protein